MSATVNPRNNLAHCFCCRKNLNNIDLLLTLDYDFRAAVTLLEQWLQQYEAQPAHKKSPLPSQDPVAVHLALPARSQHSGRRAPTGPTASRLRSPEFSGIRENALPQAAIPTALIR
jgi:hypothetical protein